MRPVLIMADIHDEQILLKSRRDMRVVGVFDWGGVRIDHPAWDFNFGEWNFTIFKYASRFQELCEVMWTVYLRRRGLRLSTPHGLHLFHTLNEFTWRIQRRKEKRIGITRRSFRDSVALYCRRLEAATKILA
jgi:aminoglycoside phosphotransferase (APT) family kinase protein